MTMRIRLTGLGVIALLATAGCQAPGQGNASTVWPPPQPRVFHCYRATGPIQIDGKLDDPAWQRAEVISRFYQPVSFEPPSAGAEVRLLWDDTHLYVGGRLRDKDVYSMLKGHDVETWKDDALEVFVKPSDKSHAYWELHVTPAGTTLDLMFPRRGAGSWLRFVRGDSGMRAAATVQGTLNRWRDVDEGWTAEMAIPLRALSPTATAPKPGTTWRFAICRYNYSVHLPPGQIGGSALEFSSTARLPKIQYHLYEYYDLLRFETHAP